MEFVRFPRTPHLLWLADGEPRDDKVLPPSEVDAFLDGVVRVEEKVDGANVGVSVTADGDLRAQNRGAYLERQTCHPQFRPLFRWMDERRARLTDLLAPHLILFGEWCYAVHSVRYTRLPDWFLAFDIYDRQAHAFWSAARRDVHVAELGLALVPTLAEGRFDRAAVTRLLGPSRLTDGPAEGVYLRRDDATRLVGRAKVVRPEFVQQIGEHWTSRAMETNRLRSGAIW